MDDYLHGAGVGTQEAGINLNEVANLDGPVEANAAGIHGHGVFPGPFHRAGGGGFVDPFHCCAAVDFAAPVHVHGFGQKSRDHARGFRRAVVSLLVHLRLDGAPQLNTRHSCVMHAQFLFGAGLKRGHRLGLAGFGVFSNENHQAVAGAGKYTLAWIRRKHLIDNVHR